MVSKDGIVNGVSCLMVLTYLFSQQPHFKITWQLQLRAIESHANHDDRNCVSYDTWNICGAKPRSPYATEHVHW